MNGKSEHKWSTSMLRDQLSLPSFDQYCTWSAFDYYKSMTLLLSFKINCLIHNRYWICSWHVFFQLNSLIPGSYQKWWSRRIDHGRGEDRDGNKGLSYITGWPPSFPISTLPYRPGQCNTLQCRVCMYEHMRLIPISTLPYTSQAIATLYMFVCVRTCVLRI